MKRTKRSVVSSIFVVFLSFLVALSVLAVWIYWSNCTFEETFYTLYSSKIDAPVRAILLADLHQAEFGKDNDLLVSRIEELRPDIILIAGDIVTAEEEDIDYAVDLCERLTQIAPVYFGLGNHENKVIYGNDLDMSFLEANKEQLGDHPEDFSGLVKDDTLLAGLKNAGVTILQNEAVSVTVNENQIEIGGISTNLSSFWPYSGQFVYNFVEDEPQKFKIMISHRPEPVMDYIAGYDLDLVVSGHTHGGIIRIPGKGGLLSADGGFFPQYDAGMLERGAMTVIISRGLGGHGMIPRVFNQPELVIIDIN